MMFVIGSVQIPGTLKQVLPSSAINGPLYHSSSASSSLKVNVLKPNRVKESHYIWFSGPGCGFPLKCFSKTNFSDGDPLNKDEDSSTAPSYLVSHGGVPDTQQKSRSVPSEASIADGSNVTNVNGEFPDTGVFGPQTTTDESLGSTAYSSASTSLPVQQGMKEAIELDEHIRMAKEVLDDDPLKEKSEKISLMDSTEQMLLVDSTEPEKISVIRSNEQPKNKQPNKLFNIVFVSSEVAPYSKTGGLGDVCGSLPIALAARGHRVMVISPRYINGETDDRYSAALDAQCRIKVDCFEGSHQVAFFHEYRDGVDWVFVDHASYHRPGNPYGDQYGTFGDNQFRFTILSYAACEAPLVLPLGGYTYGEKCLFIVNDWHASLVSVLLSAKYRSHGVYCNARSILLIHNLAHQGVEPATTYGCLGLPSEWYGSLEWVFPTWARKHALDRGEAVNPLKGAVVTADRILTVSQGYAWEITTAEGGWGLDGLLRSRQSVINGIINGIDIDDWNPATDQYIACQYSSDDLSGKEKCKAALQKELGLAVRRDVPLIGFIGRLDYQKGIDLIQSSLPELMQEDVQFVMLGSGASNMESWMKWAESTYNQKFRGWVGFNVPISHRITAGCDILLMPSRFEPCGLNQLYAMRYGTIPVVHCTGGLRDTVKDFDPYANEGAGAGTGWRFSPLTQDAMIGTLQLALETFRKYKGSWKAIMKRAMQQDFSWDNAASQYEQVFAWAMMDPPYVS